MPVIRLVPQDPTDLVVQGEQLRSEAMIGGLFSSDSLADITASHPTHIDRLASLIEGDQSSMFPPNELVIAGDQMTMGMTGGRPVGCVDVLTSQDNGGLSAAANAVICTPCGAIYPVRLGQHLMDGFTESTVLFQITGITREGTGATLGNCRVVALDISRLVVGGWAVASEVMSDGSGNFVLPVPNNNSYQLIAYKPGAPDVGGVTVNTVAPTPVA